jgi:hypothetical protein
MAEGTIVTRFLASPLTHAANALVPRQALKPRGGYALVAAKSYYFGVGGGTRQFEEIVRADGTCGYRHAWGRVASRVASRVTFPAKQRDCAAHAHGRLVGDRLYAGGASAQLRRRGVQREGAASAVISQRTDLIQ